MTAAAAKCDADSSVANALTDAESHGSEPTDRQRRADEQNEPPEEQQHDVKVDKADGAADGLPTFFRADPPPQPG